MLLSFETVQRMNVIHTVPIVVTLLNSPVADVREQAVRALSYIAGESHLSRDYVLRHRALPLLLNRLAQESNESSIVRGGVLAISKMCGGKPQPSFDLVRIALPTLAKLIHSEGVEVLSDTCWALSFLSDGTNDRIQAVIDASVCPRLVELLDHPSVSVHKPALRTISNIVTGEEYQTQFLLDECSALLPLLKKLLSSSKKEIQREACWAISNINAGSISQIQAVIDAGVMETIIDMLRNSQTRFEVRKEAAWAIANATTWATPDQMEYLIRHNVIKPLCSLLTCKDVKAISIALEVC